MYIETFTTDPPFDASHVSDVALCKLWLKADDIPGLTDGDSVWQWRDRSIFGWNAEQPFSGEQPTYRSGVWNGKWPALHFNGSQFLQTVSDSHTSYSPFDLTDEHGITIFAVIAHFSGDVEEPASYSEGVIPCYISGSGTLHLERPEKYVVFDPVPREVHPEIFWRGESEETWPTWGDPPPSGLIEPTGTPILDYNVGSGTGQNWQLGINYFDYLDSADLTIHEIDFTLNQPGCNGHIVAVWKQDDNTSASIWDNNNLVASSGSPGDHLYVASPLTIGADLFNNTYFSGDLSELIIYDGALDSAEFHSVTSYLNRKYCVPGTYSLPLTIVGSEAAPIADSITLYEFGGSATQASIPLFEASSQPINNNFPLFLQQNDLAGNIPLYIKGITAGVSNLTKWTDLFIEGAQSLNSSIPLFLEQVPPPSESLNLFLQGITSAPINNVIPLSIYGTNSSAYWLNSSIPLFIGSSFQTYLNLFINGVDQGTSLQSLNLFINGSNKNIFDSFPLTLFNTGVALSGFQDLYIRGTGLNPGFIPASESLYLYLLGSGSGTLSCPIDLAGSIPLSILGGDGYLFAYELDNAMALFLMTQDSNPINQNITLYVLGGTVPSLNNSANLVIPNVSLTSSFPMFIHGF